MIRRIVDSDRLYIYSIIEKEFNNKYQKDNIYTRWYIYEIKDKIVGFINYDVIYDKIEIEYIYVNSNYRNNGIATKLLNRLIEDVEKECNSITLEVNQNNEVAIKFYKKNKFKSISVRKNYYGNEDAILMQRSW